MTVYRVMIDVHDPKTLLKMDDLNSIVENVVLGAKVDLAPRFKLGKVEIKVPKSSNTSNGYLNELGWHQHDGKKNGCPTCQGGYGDSVS